MTRRTIISLVLLVLASPLVARAEDSLLPEKLPAAGMPAVFRINLEALTPEAIRQTVKAFEAVVPENATSMHESLKEFHTDIMPAITDVHKMMQDAGVRAIVMPIQAGSNEENDGQDTKKSL
jgi:hypothetical protein